MLKLKARRTKIVSKTMSWSLRTETTNKNTTPKVVSTTTTYTTCPAV